MKSQVQKIYIVRHGQTDFNLKGIIQGSGVDSSLNSTGRKQADAFYTAYKEIEFDKFYTSGLKRTRESIASFLSDSSDITALNELNEISWGPFDGILNTQEKNTYYWKMLESWNDGNVDNCIEGGESPVMVKERIERGWGIITKDTTSQNILVCMHGRAIRILLCHITGIELKRMDEFVHTNLGLYLIEVENGQSRIVLKNDSAHLK